MDDPANLWGDADSAPVVPESVEKTVEKTSVSVEVLQQSESDEKQIPPTVPPLVISSVKTMSHLQPDTPSPLSAVGNSVPTSSILPPPSSAGTATPLDPSSVTSSHAEADTEEVNGSLEQNGDIQPVEKKERSLEPPKMSQDLWVHVLFRMNTERDVKALAASCAPLRKALLDPAVVGSWLVRKSTTYLAIYHAYQNFPSLLTTDVLRNMLSLGAHIPRYLALLIGYQQKELVSNCQKQQGEAATQVALGDFEPPKISQNPPKLAGKKPVEDPPFFTFNLPKGAERKSVISVDALHFIIWIGTNHFGNLFGFDPDAPISVTFSPRLKRKGDDAATLATRVARMRLFRQTLEWMYNIPGAALPGSPLNVVFEVNKSNSEYPPSDAEVFAYLLSLYRTAEDAPTISVTASANPAPTSRMPPSSSSSAASSAASSPKALPSSIMPPSKKSSAAKKSDSPAQAPASLPQKPKTTTANRQTIVSSLRELCNVYRFTPGLISSSLPAGWLPIPLFEQDVELAWFLIRHSGNAKPAFTEEDQDAAAIKTLFGYKIHLNLSHPSLPPTTTDEYFPVASIQRLIQQKRIEISDRVLYYLLSEHPTPLVISRLLRLGVDAFRITNTGGTLLKECFDGPGVSEKLASGHTGILFHRADGIVSAFGLPKSVIARCFMADPVPVHGDPHQQMVSAPVPVGSKASDAMTAASAAAASSAVTERSVATPDSFDIPSPDVTRPPAESGPFPPVTLLTRQACAVGYLPWVAWQWAIKHLGAAHPVASACLHDACIRSFPDPAPINPGSIEACSFARKEADAAVKTMLSMGVKAQLCTVVAVLNMARLEVEAATASGDATQALRVQAASIQKMSRSVSRAAHQAAANATAAGAKAISRRFIYVMADVEKLLLAHGPEDFETGRVIAPEMMEASNEIVVVEYTESVGGMEKEKMEKNISVPSGDAPSPYENAWGDAPAQNGETPAASEPARTSSTVSTTPSTTQLRALMHLYPTTLLPQHRSVWLLALRSLIVDADSWRTLTASPVSPNAGRRFYIAASNIVRGLEQFGVPAAAFAALRARQSGGKALRSMSSTESRETMLYVSWMDEMVAEEVELGGKVGGGSSLGTKLAPL